MPPAPSNTAATLLATSLIIAEFDIDTGACLRACYPRVAATHTSASSPTSPSAPTPDAAAADAAAPPGIAGHTEYFANVMLPDGAEKVSVTRTVFVVNRPQPHVFLRFPVYRFLREAGNASPSPTPAGAGATAAAAASGVAAGRWSRAPGEASSLYVSEMLLINTATRAVSLRYKDTELEAPSVVPIEKLSSLPGLPHDVVRFSKQLEAMMMNEATLSGSRTGSFAAGGDTSIGDGGGSGPGTRVPSYGASGATAASSSVGGGGSGTPGSSGGMSDYAFVVIEYGADRQEGYLMRVSQFERLLKEMMVLETAERSAAAAAAKAATSLSPPPPAQQQPVNTGSTSQPLGESGPLGSLTAAQHGNSGAAMAMTDSQQYPHSESVGDVTSPATPTSNIASHVGDSTPQGGMLLPGSLTPPSPATRIDVDSYTPPPASPEGGGHLLLPSMDSTNSSTDVLGTGATPAAQRYTDPSVAHPGPPGSGTHCGGRQDGADAAASGPVLFGLCAVVSKRDSTARRGGITKSVAVLGPSLVWLEPFFPVLVAAAQYCCSVSGTNDDALKELQRILKRCYDSINNAANLVAAGRAKVDQLTSEIGKYCTLGSGQQAYVYYNDAPFGTTIKAKIPLSPESNDIAFSKYSIETLIETLGPSFMLLLLGILTEKKILILSRKGEATDVCEVALSLGLLGNLLDRNFMATKVFPYVSVSSVDHFLHVPGYVVGTLNPIFENVSPWGWDLLCDLDNRAVVTAAERALRRQIGSATSVGGGGGNWATATAGLANAVGVGSSAEAEALRSLPAPFQHLYKKLVNAIYQLRALRVGAAERNRRLRLMLEDFLYTTVLVGHVAGGTISVPSALYPTFAHRALGILRLEMMLTAMLDHVQSQVLHPRESPALLLNCAALRQCAAGETPVQRTLLNLLGLLESPYDVKLFLRRMSLAVGGLNAVGMQLTHSSPEARAAAAALLSRVESIPEGKAAVASMNNFFLMIYENGVKGARR